MKKKFTLILVSLLLGQLSSAQGCPTPPPTGAGQQTFCSTNNPLVSSLSATGTAISWYSSEFGGLPLSQSTPLSNGIYYASQTDQGCESNSRLAVTVTIHTSPPNFPGIISGSSNICVGNQTVYSLNPVANADYYIWTLPTMLDGISQTNSISTTAISSGSGIMFVSAQNACGNSGNQTKGINVNALPTQPALILGDNEVCFSTWQTYSIDPVSNATSYLWTKPSGWTGNSNTTTFNAGVGNNGGIISVVAINSCGTSAPQELLVSVIDIPSYPGTIQGDAFICSGTEQTYSVSPVNGATAYSWTFPSDWSGGSTTNMITLTVGELSGSITLNASNECGVNSSTIGAFVTVSPSAPSGNTPQAFCYTATLNDVAINGTSIQWYTDNLLAQPINPNDPVISGQMYYATQTTNGCESIQALEITALINDPAAPTGNESQTFCGSGQIEDLMLSGTNINWYIDETSFAPLSTSEILTDNTVYYATQTIDGCESLERLAVLVNINPLPNNAISLNGITLTAAQTGATYQWLDCDNAMSVISAETSQSFTAATNGNYAVEITLNGCVDTSACEAITTVGMNDISVTKVKLYPNPSTDKFTVESENGIEQVAVFNMAGELMKMETFTGATSAEFAPQLNPGMYLVKVTDSLGNLYMTQWIKQ